MNGWKKRERHRGVGSTIGYGVHSRTLWVLDHAEHRIYGKGWEDNNNNTAPPVVTVTIHVEATAGD